MGGLPGDIIITLDGDHSYPPDAISYLLEALLHLDVDFLNASRFPGTRQARHEHEAPAGQLDFVAGDCRCFISAGVRDSQSGMWVFRRSILEEMCLESDGMAFSEEIKIEALKSKSIRFAEISILYSSRLGEIKLSVAGRLLQPVFPGEEALLGGGDAPHDAVVLMGGVAIVIPTWNRSELLAQVLADLGRQTYPIGRVIVVDNGSTDDSAAVAARAGAEVITMGGNAGFAAAVNRGIQSVHTSVNAARTSACATSTDACATSATSMEWIGVLNNDVTLEPRLAEPDHGEDAGGCMVCDG